MTMIDTKTIRNTVLEAIESAEAYLSFNSGGKMPDGEW
jgi:hypothetical protein